MSNQENQKANEKPDLPETFIQGSGSAVQGRISALLAGLHQISPRDNPEAYAGAQFNLGVVYNDQNKPDQAIAAWSKVRHSDDPGTYAKA